MAASTENLELFSRDKSAAALKLLLEHLNDKYGLSSEEMISAVAEDKESIPLAAFENGELSALEIVVKFMKEDRNMSYHEIALILNRDDRTVWSSYSNSKKKFKGHLSSKKSGYSIPFVIFSDRSKSPLSCIVEHLLKKDLSYKEISELLNKDYQTIYTTHRRGLSR